MSSERLRSRRIRPPAAIHRPPPEPPGDIGVLATMTLGDRTQWLRVGIAHVDLEAPGAGILSVQLGAIPIDRHLYIPLGDVLKCCGVELPPGDRLKRRA